MISRWLKRESETSMYGYGVLGVPPEELYSEYDARKALEDAELALELSARLYKEVTGEEIKI